MEFFPAPLEYPDLFREQWIPRFHVFPFDRKATFQTKKLAWPMVTVLSISSPLGPAIFVRDISDLRSLNSATGNYTLWSFDRFRDLRGTFHTLSSDTATKVACSEC